MHKTPLKVNKNFNTVDQGPNHVKSSNQAIVEQNY